MKKYRVRIHQPFTSMWADRYYDFEDPAEAEADAARMRAEHGYDTQISWMIPWQHGDWIKADAVVTE